MGLRHQEAEERGLPPQQLPRTMPSLEYRRVWHIAKAESSVTVSIWHPIGPPGYRALGDVITLGLDPPTAPVQVRQAQTVPSLQKAQQGGSYTPCRAFEIDSLAAFADVPAHA